MYPYGLVATCLKPSGYMPRLLVIDVCVCVCVTVFAVKSSNPFFPFYLSCGTSIQLNIFGHVTCVRSHYFMVSMYQTAIIGGGLVSYPMMECQGKMVPVHAGSLALPLDERRLKSKHQSVLPGSPSLFFSYSLCCHC